MTLMGQTAGWAANARIKECATASVDVNVPQDGEDRTVKKLVSKLIDTLSNPLCKYIKNKHLTRVKAM